MSRPSEKPCRRLCALADLYLSCYVIAEVRPDAKGVDCCTSCHSDHDECGYDLCAVDGPDGSVGEHSGGVCCTMSRYLELQPLTAEEWERLRVLS